MNQVPGVKIALAAAAIAVLAGCSASPQTPPLPSVEQHESVESVNLSEDAFLTAVRGELIGQAGSQISLATTNESLLVAGYRACEQMAAGEEVRVVTDERPTAEGNYADSAELGEIAVRTALCS